MILRLSPYPISVCTEKKNTSLEFEAFTAVEVGKILSCYQPCQLVKNFPRFRDDISPRMGSTSRFLYKYVRQLQFCPCGTSSLASGRVCQLSRSWSWYMVSIFTILYVSFIHVRPLSSVLSHCESYMRTVYSFTCVAPVTSIILWPERRNSGARRGGRCLAVAQWTHFLGNRYTSNNRRTVGSGDLFLSVLRLCNEDQRDRLAGCESAVVVFGWLWARKQENFQF
jgi:hypothetical protein